MDASNALPEDIIRDWKRSNERLYFTFKPRPDQPERYDEQTAFMESKATGINFLIGGNGAGTTTTSLAKAIKLMLRDHPAPRPATPFWIISEGYPMVMDVCWNEKMCGLGLLPEEEVQWDMIDWYKPTQNWPFRVPLKPWPGHDPRNYWVIEFKSYSQGRSRMQASSIGGFCFVEQCPFDLIKEVNRGCRVYNFPGSKIAEFTPIDPILSQPLEEMLRDGTLPESWRVFRCNTECAMEAGHVSKEWFDEFFGMLPPEEKEVRMIGAFAGFDGMIYPSFMPTLHVQDNVEELIAPSMLKYRSIDWGSGVDNAFVNLWGAKDGLGTWYIYDEYYSTDQKYTYLDHADEINKKQPWDRKSQFYRDTYADPSAPGLMRTFSQKCGIPITPAKNDVLPGISCVREAMKMQHGEPKLIIDSKCKNLIRELQTYRWETNRNADDQYSKDRSNKPLKKDDHTCFIAGTKVHTPNGEVAIESVNVGDVVLGHLGWTRVVQSAQTGRQNCVTIHQGKNDVTVTPTHPMAAFNCGWVLPSKIVNEHLQVYNHNKKVDFCDFDSLWKLGYDVTGWSLPTEAGMTSIGLARNDEQLSEMLTHMRTIRTNLPLIRKAGDSYVKPAGVHDVYNVATESGTVVANGFVTSNCDALRYMLFSAESAAKGGDVHGARIRPKNLSRYTGRIRASQSTKMTDGETLD